MTIACSSIAPSWRSSREQQRKKRPKYCQPTASIISIETSLS